MPMATMADAAREYHSQGLACPFDCARCDPNEGLDYDPADTAAYSIQTSYGLLYADTMAEAKDIARQAAVETGRRTVIKKIEREAPAPAADPDHDDPCVCGTYDRCKAQRARDARGLGAGAAFRAMHRAYND